MKIETLLPNVQECINIHLLEHQCSCSLNAFIFQNPCNSSSQESMWSRDRRRFQSCKVRRVETSDGIEHRIFINLDQIR